jgi:hypothetical protein
LSEEDWAEIKINFKEKEYKEYITRKTFEDICTPLFKKIETLV